MQEHSLKKSTVLLNGIKGLCPNCGHGKLFRSYLKQHDHCDFCGEDFSYIRADDAPPWLTILITGHILAPMIVDFAKDDVLSPVIEVSILSVTALLCIGCILPLAKGLFIAAIWLTQKKKV